MKTILGYVGKKNVSIVVLMLFVLVLVFATTVAANEDVVGTQTAVPKEIPKIPLNAAIIAGIIISIAFGGILCLGWLKDHTLDKGEMRRAIAGTFVVGFTVLVFLCLHYGIYQKEVVIAYIELVGIVIGFYFGAKIASEKKP